MISTTRRVRGLNQNRMLVHVSVSVTRHVVLSRHLIIRNSLLGQDRTDAKFLVVSYGTWLHPKRFQLEHRYFILRSRKSQSEHTMNIFYIIGVVVVVLVIAGYFGLHV